MISRGISNIRLSSGQIKKNISSYVDPNGYVFESNGLIYRAIRKESAHFYRGLFEDGSIDRLISSCYLVPSFIADIEIDDASVDLVIQHEKVEPISYCVEWCPSMLCDAARITIKLLQELLDKNMTLQDAYPWNVLFRGPNPVFIDLTSVVEINTSLLWPAFDQFQAFFMRPLILARQRNGNMSRLLLMNNSIQGISLYQFFYYTNCLSRLKHPLKYLEVVIDRFIQKNSDLKKRLRSAVQKKHITVNKQMRTHFYKRLSSKLDSFRFDSNTDVWSEYYGSLTANIDKNAKLRVVNEIITRSRPASVVDLGCNTGIFSVLAAERGARVVSIDSSEDCISRLYSLVKEKHLNITPLISDVVCPTPSFGFMGTQYPSLIQRAKSEMVLCLALMHHLHISGRQSFDRIASLLSSLSDKYLIFEFVAMDDSNNDLLGAGRIINYSLDDVITEIKRFFPEITTFDSDRPTRKILLCSKNNI